MEKELWVGLQKIQFDRDATIAFYAQTIKIPGADDCACIFCRNFAAQRHNIFPTAFIEFLRELGVDPAKEWEAFDYDFDAKNPSKLILYGGWFLFVGQLLEGLETPPPLQDDFAYWFTSSFPTGTLPVGAKLCALQFLKKIPWVLSEIPS
jgi:hypothetical protein